jgi:amino acid adenylation domain-containing protein
VTDNAGGAAGFQDEVGFLLSSQQERLWTLFGEQVPSAQIAIRVMGALDGARLRQALEAAVARHEILRTAFVRPAGLRAPVQVVRERGSICWDTADLCADRSVSDRQRRLDQLLKDQIEGPFDLEGGGLLRATLVAGEDEHVLVLSAPSIVLDVMSLELLAREALRGSVEEEPLQYGDYVAWQQEQLELDGAGGAEAQAGEDPAPTALPLARWPAGPAGTEPLEVRVPVAAEAVARIERLGPEPQDGWLALWSVLLARLTGQTRVTVEVSMDGRAQEELAGALGPFARSVPVSVEIESRTSLQELVQALTPARRSAAENQERRRPAAGSPAVGFSHSHRHEPLQLAGVQATLISSRCDDDALQIRLDVRPDAEGVELVLRCHPTVVPRVEAERVASHLGCLADAVGGGATGEAWRLEVLPEQARRRLLGELGAASVASATVEGSEGCVHWRFEDRAALAPEAPAVRLGDRLLSYGQLNERANGLAHALRARGVGPGATVSILLERSPELIVAVLGALKAGGAYLPLNPDHPAARLAFQQRDAGASLVLTQGSLAAVAAELPGAVLRVDEGLEAEPTSNPERVNDRDDLVYVIYTSGSTGVPKGVEVTHAGLASYTAAIIDRLALAGSEPLRFGVVTTISTDLGNTSVFPALCSGGCLELVPVQAAMDGEAFAAQLASYPIDVLKITPSHLAALLASGERAALPRRWLILGGEAAPWSLVEQVRGLGGSSCAIVNHYGPTETTVGSLTYDVGERDGAAAPSLTVPIGRPLAGAEIYVVDEHLQPVPVGAPGELLIGGVGVARGYRNQPEQTAERFIANPFFGERGVAGERGASEDDSEDPASQARVYRTGDVVRFLADGNVEFLGRADGQVKVRGFRVEVAEVEAVLGGHPGASQVVVVLREGASGERRLVAYVVGWASIEDLRALARERLPDYMVPSAFVRIEALPLTPNGKLDRAALPAPDPAGGSTREYVAPSTEVELRLAEIWGQALGVERVGAQDDFFELGGHSLLATQVIARIRSAYDVQLPLHSLFTSPRIADLAAEVEAARHPVDPQEDPELTALLEDLEGLSDEEAERLLALERSASEEQSRAGSDRG